MMEPFSGRHQFDLVVVGSGIAGLYAALLAAPYRRVLLVTKGQLQESNTRYAQGGIAVAMRDGDSAELHRRDTIAAGDGLCNLDAVTVMTREAPADIRALIERGVGFDTEDGHLSWTLEAAHSMARVLHAGGDATGASVERTLAAAVRDAGVAVWENTFCTEITVENSRVAGVKLVTATESTAVRVPFVILASGGAGQLFWRTTNPAVATGDGIALAYRAGAAVTDMEFIQFHPTALVLESAPSFLISEAVRGEGGILRDGSGHAFMDAFHPDRELAPRDVVARAIHTQMERTSTECVGLDITHLPAETVERRFPTILAFCRAHGIEPLREPIPVAPAAHYVMGGILTDTHARTSVHGLLACGEVACTGVHGANRLASNSLLEGLVFARRAVATVLDEELSQVVVRPHGRPLPGRVPDPSGAVLPNSRAGLQREMWRSASLVRSAASLQAVNAHASALRMPGVPATVAEHEASNLALLSQLVTHAALLREESRGGHFRSDYPERSPAWQSHTVMTAEGAYRVPHATEVGAGV
jgi:L-aspartate oxidase